jgi:arsenite methyltransferase
MTDEMLALAGRNAAEAGATNVEFLKGHIEAIPLPAASIDVVISNCVVNLAADKPSVFREIDRVLRPGGRIGISDIVADDNLTPEQVAERGSYEGCIAGALTFSEFRTGLEAAGLADVSVAVSHAVADGMYSAIVKATKPLGGAAVTPGEAGNVDAIAGAAPSSCGCGGGCCG